MIRMYKPQTTLLNKEQVKKDKVLNEGMSIRLRGQVLFYVSIIASGISLIKGNWITDILVVMLIIFGWKYSKLFRKWELRNRDYITQLGFEVKG